MLFRELAVGQKFKVNDEVWTKVDEVHQTCCRAGYNANKDGVVRHFSHDLEVELINE